MIANLGRMISPEVRDLLAAAQIEHVRQRDAAWARMAVDGRSQFGPKGSGMALAALEPTNTANPNPWGVAINADGQIVVDDYTREVQQIPEIVRTFAEDNEGYWIEEVFNSPGWTITGGAVIYTVTDADNHFLQPGQEWAPRAPGAEAPKLAGTRRRRIITAPENLSGRIEIHDEARRTNNIADVERDFRQAANSFAQQLQTRGEEALTALIADQTRFVNLANGTFGEWNESPVVNSTTAMPYPGQEFANVQRRFFEEKGGVQADTLMWSPEDAERFYNIYGDRGQSVLREHGITRTLRSVRLTAGRRRYLKAGQVGYLAWEKPMDTEEVREGLRKTDTYVMDASFLFVANGADAILEMRDNSGD